MKVKTFLQSTLARPLVQRALHTFWQAALGVLVAGIFTAHSPQDVKALVVAAVAAGASATKSSLATYIQGRRS